jgi:hypothetical protein
MTVRNFEVKFEKCNADRICKGDKFFHKREKPLLLSSSYL